MKKRTLLVVGVIAAAGGIGAGVAFAEHGGGHGWGKYGRHDGGWGRPRTVEDALDRARGRFGRADEDGDGIVTRDELEARILSRMERLGERGGRRGRGPRGMMHGAQRMMRRADADNDGTLTRAEFDAFVAARFKRADLTGDGVISNDDLPPGMRMDDLTQRGRGHGYGRHHRRHGRKGRWGHGGHGIGRMMRMVVRADANGDGRVTEDEVKQFANDQFARFDRNRDDALNRADRETFKKEMAAYMAARMLHRLDATEAGQVTREQWLNHVRERFEQRSERWGDDEMRRGRRGRHGWGRRHRGEDYGEYRRGRRGGGRDRDNAMSDDELRQDDMRDDDVAPMTPDDDASIEGDGGDGQRL